MKYLFLFLALLLALSSIPLGLRAWEAGRELLVWIDVSIFAHRTTYREIHTRGFMLINASTLSSLVSRSSWIVMNIRITGNITVRVLSQAQVKVLDNDSLVIITRPPIPLLASQGDGSLTIEMNLYLLMKEMKCRVIEGRGEAFAIFQVDEEITPPEGWQDLLMVIGFPSPTNLVIMGLDPGGSFKHEDDALVKYALGSMMLFRARRLFKGRYKISMKRLNVYIPRSYGLNITASDLSKGNLIMVPTERYLNVSSVRGSILIANVTYVPHDASLDLNGSGAILWDEIIDSSIRLRHVEIISTSSLIMKAIDRPIYADIKLLYLFPSNIGSSNQLLSVIRYPRFDVIRGSGEVLYASPFLLVVRNFKAEDFISYKSRISLQPVNAEGSPINEATVKVEVFNVSALGRSSWKDYVFSRSPLCLLSLGPDNIMDVTVIVGGSEVLRATLVNPPTLVALPCSIYDLRISTIDWQNQPLHNTTLELLSIRSRTYAYKGHSLLTHYVEGIPRGRYEVKVYWRGKLVYHDVILVEGSSDLVLKCNVYRLGVKVFTHELKELSGAYVLLNDSRGLFTFAHRTNSSGIAVFRQVPLGEYDISVRWRGIEVYRGHMNLNASLRLLPLTVNVSTLEVVITDAHGNPLEGANVTVSFGNFSMSRISDVTGLTEFHDVPFGSYTIRISIGSLSTTAQVRVNEPLKVKVPLPIIFRLGNFFITTNDIKLLAISLASLATALVAYIVYRVKRGRTIVIS